MLLKISKLSKNHLYNTYSISYFTKLPQPVVQFHHLNLPEYFAKIRSQRKIWTLHPQTHRKQILLKFYNNLSKDKQSLAENISRSTGKQLISAIQQVQQGLTLMKRQLNQKFDKRVIIQDKGYGSGYYDLMPYGTILQICNHHSPFLTSVKYLIPSLISNNSIILHSNHLAFPFSHKIQNIWKESCEEDNNLLIANFQKYEEGKNSLHFDKLIQTSDVGFISYTGQVQDGIRLYHQLAMKSESFADTQFLLHGCDSCHILKDLSGKTQKLIKCAKIISKNAFSNGGTLPNSIKRLFIDPEMIEEFLPYLLAQAKKYKFQFDEVQHLNKSTLSAVLKSQYESTKNSLQQIEKKPQQFKLLFGNFTEAELPAADQQLNKTDFILFHPAIIQVLSQYPSFAYQSQTYQLPILFIHPTKSINQAIQLINSSIYGLSHTIFTQDKKIIDDIENIGSKIDVGTINVNNCDFKCDLPISPRKRSGKGFYNSLRLDSITRSKSVTF